MTTHDPCDPRVKRDKTRGDHTSSRDGVEKTSNIVLEFLDPSVGCPQGPPPLSCMDSTLLEVVAFDLLILFSGHES